MDRSTTIPADLLPIITENSSFEMKKHKILLKMQQMVNRYNECFSRLRIELSDVSSLHQENLELKAANLQLKGLISEREKLVLKEVKKEKEKENRVERSDLTPPHGSGSSSGSSGGTRVIHPKNISIRSREFLTGDSTGEKPRVLRVLSPSPSPGSDGGSQQGELEVEVFSQGMEKTELCNKWAGPPVGGCPYNDKCRFAHGIEELRPVLRHPRYKTQVCNMFNSDTGCPYGHRCHFKHAVGSGLDLARV